jgi:hypothetical protein
MYLPVSRNAKKILLKYDNTRKYIILKNLYCDVYILYINVIYTLLYGRNSPTQHS